MQETTVVQVAIRQVTARQTAVRQESARLWNRMVKLHLYFRRKRLPWPTKGQFERHFKGRFALHSQTVQALIQKFFANIDTARTNRQAGDKRSRYPHKTKRYTSTPWKGQAIVRTDSHLELPMGRGRAPLRIRVGNLPPGDVVAAELGFHVLRITLKREAATGSPGDAVIAIDPGVIHLAVATDGQDSLAIVGRGLRANAQLHNKRKAAYAARQARCKKGSRRWRKLQRRKATARAYRDNVQRNTLHHAANQLVAFAAEKQAEQVVIGDIREISRGKRGKMSRRTNQENGNNALGQLSTYLTYKLRRIGARLVHTSESYTTQTCPACGHRHKPAGRLYRCRSTDCSFEGVRDEVGASNIRNRAINGTIVSGFSIPSGIPKYLRPAKSPVQRTRSDVVEPLMRATLPTVATAAVSALSSDGGKTPLRLPKPAELSQAVGIHAL